MFSMAIVENLMAIDLTKTKWHISHRPSTSNFLEIYVGFLNADNM